MKKTLTAAVASINVCLFASLLSGAVVAQGVGSVVESQAFTPGQAQSQSTSSNRNAGGNSDGLSLLLEQNRQLQAEVSALRGLVEEQGFEIRKMQRDSLNRYTSTDQRLSNLETAPANPVASSNLAVPSTNSLSNRTVPSSGAVDGLGNAGGTSTTPATGLPANSINNGGASSTSNSVGASTINTPRSVRNGGRRTLEPVVLSEQQLYQMAYESVIGSNFANSIAEFDQYLSIYPSGRFVTNAHYWKGQAYLYLNRYTESRDAYEIILNQYPDASKTQDATYGLALAYQGMGNIAQARRLLNEIQTKYPGTGAANLARTRLLTLD